jgi:hypothetical protein
MKIGWFSAGITSAVACKLALQNYDDVELYYIQIDSAHEDNKRFIADCEKWYGKKINILKSKKYNDQFEVAEKKRYLNGPAGAACTKSLKKDVRFELQKQYPDANQIFGFEFEKKEINRAVRFSQQNQSVKPLYPLIEMKMTKQMCAELLLMNRIRLPKMYELGYHNNNCIGCVKGGKGYWNKIRKDFPTEFEKMKDIELQIGHSCINGTFLNDLLPNEGRNEPPILPDCGNFCEIELADLISPITDEVLNDSKRIKQLYLF